MGCLVLCFVGICGCPRADSSGLGQPDAWFPNPDSAAGDSAVRPDHVVFDAVSFPDGPLSDGTLPDAQLIDVLVQPDACVPADVQILLNESFDQGHVSWVENGAGYDVIWEETDFLVALHTPSYGVWLGGLDDTNRSIYQDVAVPAGASSMRLSGQYWIVTEETTPTVYDTLTITIRSTTNTLLETLGTWSNVNETSEWTSFTFHASGSYGGQTIRLHLESSQDSSYNTNFFFDTFSLQVTVCQ